MSHNPPPDGFSYRKATREQTRLRIALYGYEGTGKTYSALRIAAGIVRVTGGRILLVDTEGGRAAKYADEFDFDHGVLERFAPADYLMAMDMAERDKHAVLIFDSLSHSRTGPGGIIDQVDRMKRDPKMAAIAWANVTPQEQMLVSGLLNPPCHIICTMRVKTAYESVGGSRKKIGLAPDHREDMSYNFDLCLNFFDKMIASVDKSDIAVLRGLDQIERPDEALGEKLAKWVADGVVPVEPPRGRQRPQPADHPPAARAQASAGAQPVARPTGPNLGGGRATVGRQWDIDFDGKPYCCTHTKICNSKDKDGANGPYVGFWCTAKNADGQYCDVRTTSSKVLDRVNELKAAKDLSAKLTMPAGDAAPEPEFNDEDIPF